MEIGMILLDPNNIYVYSDGSLPVRPSWDKGYITSMIEGKTVLCSQNVLETIPHSMLNIAKFITDHNHEFDINWGISTFNDIPDILLVTRSKVAKRKSGKTFRLNNYTRINTGNSQLEIWMPK